VKRLKLAALLLILAITGGAVSQDHIAYIVPAGTSGHQEFTGSLGMDFVVNSDIVVTQLGVFHDSTFIGPDLQTDLEAKLYFRDPTYVCNTLLATLEFPVGDEGTPMDSSFFKPLPTPITLPAGFTGTIEASGYGVNGVEPNGNVTAAGPGPWYTDDGGGLISFVGGGRFGDPNNPSWFPTSVDGGPANRYAAGTFIYHAATGGDAPLPPHGHIQDCNSIKTTILVPGLVGPSK
jgi:hypothetical protein